MLQRQAEGVTELARRIVNELTHAGYDMASARDCPPDASEARAGGLQRSSGGKLSARGHDGEDLRDAYPDARHAAQAASAPIAARIS